MYSNSDDVNLVAPISLKQDPGFETIVVFDFYDGPERGLAVCPNGVGVRFLSVGDSRSRLFRAFSFEVLKGNWLAEVRPILSKYADDLNARVFNPSEPSGLIDHLENLVNKATVSRLYLGLGSPYLEWVAACLASDKLLVSAEKDGFPYVHKILKTLL